MIQIKSFSIRNHNYSSELLQDCHVYFLEVENCLDFDSTSFRGILSSCSANSNRFHLIDKNSIRSQTKPLSSFMSKSGDLFENDLIILNTFDLNSETISFILGSYDLSPKRPPMVVICLPSHVWYKYLSLSTFHIWPRQEKIEKERPQKIFESVKNYYRDLRNWVPSGLILISFCLLHFFGATTQVASKNAFFEYVTNFSIENGNPRYHANFFSNEPISYSRCNEIQSISKNGEYSDFIDAYYVAGESGNFKRFTFSYGGFSFESTIASVAFYANQNKELMEMINFEQYKVPSMPDFLPENGADGGCYLPTFIADQIIAYDSNDSIQDYDDVLELSFDVTDSDLSSFSQTISINNLIYVNENSQNITSSSNGYQKLDDGLGRFVLDSIGPFVISYNPAVFNDFGASFCFDFFGRNALIKSYIEDCFGNEFGVNGRLEISSVEENSLIRMTSFEQINVLYSYENSFFGDAFFLLLAFSLCFFGAGLSLFVYQNSKKRRKSGDLERRLFLVVPLLFPLLFMQILLMVYLAITKGSIESFLLFNEVGSIGSEILIFFAIIVCGIVHDLILKKERHYGKT